MWQSITEHDDYLCQTEEKNNIEYTADDTRG